MTIKEILDGMTPSTASEYRTSYKYFQEWKKRKRLFPTFADFLLSIEMSQWTRVKHLNTAKAIARRLKQSYEFGTLKSPPEKIPPSFSDEDFQKLYSAFQDCDYPKVIPEGWQRFRYWQTLIHFAVVTATRRQAILGMKWEHINLQELYITVDPEIDKMGRVRYKPITAELAEQLVELKRFYSGVPAKMEGHVFPWSHGNKIWYRCWREAESKVGKRFHLHDLKRYSGELALRAGATPLELQQHMDHASLTTTMKHYCRPQTKGMVSRMKVPLTLESAAHAMPLFSAAEITALLERIVAEQLAEAMKGFPKNMPIEHRIPRKRKGRRQTADGRRQELYSTDLLSEDSEREEAEEGGGV